MQQPIDWPAVERRFEALAVRLAALRPEECPDCHSTSRSERRFLWKETAFGSDGSRCAHPWHNQNTVETVVCRVFKPSSF